MAVTSILITFPLKIVSHFDQKTKKKMIQRKQKKCDNYFLCIVIQSKIKNNIKTVKTNIKLLGEECSISTTHKSMLDSLHIDHSIKYLWSKSFARSIKLFKSSYHRWAMYYCNFNKWIHFFTRDKLLSITPQICTKYTWWHHKEEFILMLSYFASVFIRCCRENKKVSPRWDHPI